MRVLVLLLVLSALPAQAEEPLELRLTLVLFAGGAWTEDEAEAIGRGNSRSRPELADTVWIVHDARDPGVALAHELAHVLLDSGEHSDEPGNLMRDETTPQNTRLSAVQCERLRASGAAHGLLAPASR